MNATKVANTLKIWGVTVQSVSQGSARQDGEIVITPCVSVQVPTRGKWLSVVVWIKGHSVLKFLPKRDASDMISILDDIRKECRATSN